MERNLQITILKVALDSSRTHDFHDIKLWEDVGIYWNTVPGNVKQGNIYLHVVRLLANTTIYSFGLLHT